MTRPNRSGAIGPSCLFLGGSMLIVAGLQLLSGWLVLFWLAEVITEYLGLAGTLSTEAQRFVSSLPSVLVMAGVAVILGTAIWCASPRHPHRGTDLVTAIGKIVVSFGASIATLPLATMMFGVWATFVLSTTGFETLSLVVLVPGLGLELVSLILTGGGSVLFAGFRRDSR